MPGIMDSHSHYMPKAVAENTAFFKAGWSDVDQQLRVMDEQGFEKALLLYPNSDAHIQMGGWRPLVDIYNKEIAEAVKDSKGRLIGSGILPIDEPGNLVDELIRMKDAGLNVVSLASSYDGKFLDDEMFAPVFEYAQKHGMVVFIHPQIINPIGEERVRDPLLSPVLEYVFDVTMCLGKMMMGGVFDVYPDLNFVFAHYGGVLPFVKDRFDNTYQMLRKRNFVKDLGRLPSAYFHNIYYDTSGARSVASLLLALEITDSDHILFGSDYPANQNIRGSVETIKNKQISAADQEKMFTSNLLNLLNLC